MEMKLLQEKADKAKKAKEKAAAADQQRNEKLRQEMEARRREQDEAASKLSGRLQIMLSSLYNDESPFEYTLTGVDLSPP